MMTKLAKLTLSLIGLIYMANALLMWFMPNMWYETTPGVAAMGPFNLHFIRDIALAYFIAGAGLIYGLRNPSIAVFASLWPAAHALFHIYIFIMRGMPLDIVSATNFIGIQIPAWASFWAAMKLHKTQKSIYA